MQAQSDTVDIMQTSYDGWKLVDKEAECIVTIRYYVFFIFLFH